MAKGDDFRSSELIGVLNQVSSAINNSPSNIYINPSVLKEILALDKELSSVLNDLNLTHNEKSRQFLQRLASCSYGKLAVVSSNSGKALRIRSSDYTTLSSSIKTLSESLGSKSKSSSSISLYSTDSAISQKSGEDNDKKKNLIIRCNYNAEHQPIHVFRHESPCAVPPPLCPDSCCDNNSAFRCKGRRDMERKRKSETKDFRGNEETREIRDEETRRMKQRRHNERIRNEKKEKEKQRKERDRRKKEREKQKKERDMQRRVQERQIREREREEEKELREREREEEKYRRKMERENEKERREKEKYEVKERKDKQRDQEMERKEEYRKKKEKERVEGKERTGKRQQGKQRKCRICHELDPEESTVQRQNKSETNEPDSGELEVCSERCKQGVKPCTTCKVGVQCEIPCMCPRCAMTCKSTQVANRPTSSPSGRSRFAKFLSGFTNGSRQLRLKPPEKTCRNTKSCTIPKVRSSRTIKIDSCCGPPRINNWLSPQEKSVEEVPINSSPYVPRSIDKLTSYEPPSKLPRCSRAPSFPRLTPCLTPPCRYKQPCRMKSCLASALEPRTRTPSPPCKPNQHSSPPCSVRTPFFPPKSKMKSRTSVSFEPQQFQTVPCPPLQLPGFAPNYSRSGPSTSCTSEPGSPVPCRTSTPPLRDTSPIRISSPGNFRPSEPTRCPSQSHMTPEASQLYSPCSSEHGSTPRTPTRSFHDNPKAHANPNCNPDSNLPGYPQPCDQNPYISDTTPYPCPPELSDSKQENHTCGRPFNCLGSHKPEPFRRDLQCSMKKWNCCTKRMQHSVPEPSESICSRGSIHGVDTCARKCFRHRINPMHCQKPCRKGENPYSPSCSDSDICHPGSPCRSRRCSPSSAFSREDTCYLRRKYSRPWWAPRSPSSCSFGGCSDCRQRCAHRNHWSPHVSEDEFCYPPRYPCHPWWSYYPLDGPCYSMRSMRYPSGYNMPGPPKECVSIPCTPSPGGLRPCSPPRKSLSCTPPSGRTQCGLPQRHRCASPSLPPPCHLPPPPCMPHPAHFPPLYPPPYLPCPSPCTPQFVPQTGPPCPSYSPTPCSSKTSAPSCRPQPGSRIRAVSTSGPMASNQAIDSTCGSQLRRPKFFKEPAILKKFSKCPGTHGMKRLRFPKPGDVKPCGSQIPGCRNIRYPTPSVSSYGSNYWPYPSAGRTYQPYDYWPNQFQGYGGYPPCYPDQEYPRPRSPFSKVSLSKLKCSKLYHMSCKSGFPEKYNSRSSSDSSNSSCSSSNSTLSSSDSTYTSRSSSSTSSSSSSTSPSYCIASCRNSSSNLFNCERKLSNSSIGSSRDCSPNRQKCVSNFPYNYSPPLPEVQQKVGPMACRLPVSFARSQVCSSATELQCEHKLKGRTVDHYDDRIRFELQKIGIDQLIQASKPAKCCKQTVLNQPSKEELPYAASLASLPLDRADIRVIRQSVRMASKKTDCNYTSLENRTKLVYYANLVLDDFDTGKPKVPPEYEVRYFYFTLEDSESVHFSLRKRYTKTSMFKFFQILNWYNNNTIQELETDSSLQKIDLSVSLDWRNRITPTPTGNENELVVVSSASTDTLENIVFSDLLLGNQPAVGDFKEESSLNENLLNEIKFKLANKKIYNPNTNFTKSETLDEEFLLKNNCNCESFFTGSRNIPDITSKNVDASSQTDIGGSFFHNMQDKNFSDVTSQTDDESRRLSFGSITFSEEIMRFLSNPDGDGADYRKRNERCLVFTSKTNLATEGLEVQLKSEFLKSNKELQGRNQNSNDGALKNASGNFEEAIKEVLGEIRELALIAESYQDETVNCNEFKFRDFTRQSTIYNTYTPKLPFEEYKVCANGSTNGKRECNEIIQKDSQPVIENSSWKQISKGQFIVRMYNSINNIISEIYGEAEKLSTLRKNRFAISRVGNRWSSKEYSKKLCTDVGKALKVKIDESSEIPVKKPETKGINDSLLNLRSVYTSAGKIITQFYNFKGKAVKSIYNYEGKIIAESSSSKKLAKVLFDDMGNFVSGYCDSQGNILRAVYDSQRKLLEKTFNSEMLLITLPSEDRKQKKQRIFNSQGFPIYQLYSEEGKLLTSVYDFEGNLIRGTFLGNISQLCPRIFDKNGRFILGRYNRSGKMIKRIFDCHGNNLQQLYKADRTTWQRAPVRLKILNQNGEPVRTLYKKNRIPLTHVYDVLGNLICQASQGNSKDLLYRLFDLDGFFILGRLDELRHLIEAVYDENGYKIFQVRVVDVETGDMVKMSKLYNFKGNLLVNFYDESGVYLRNIHDAKGSLVESSPSGRAVKLAGRMFDMAGYFIQGRYDARNNIIREIFDHDGYKILRVYDSNGNPVRRLPQSTRIFNFKGRPIKHFYKSDHRILSGIYDVSGDMVGGVLSIDAEELAPFLFDMEGKFINTRYDSQMNLIKHVYDSRDNLLDRVYTQDSLNPSTPKKPRPLKTVYIKVECKDNPCINASCNNAMTTFDGHCQTIPKAILSPLPVTKVTNKTSKFEVLSSRKRKRAEPSFEEGRKLVSVKCQCKILTKKEKRLNSSAPPTKCCQNPAKKKKIERSTSKVTKKAENFGKGRTETSHQNEHPKPTTIPQNSGSRQTKVPTTVMPCYETNRNDIQRNPDSLESLLDGYLQHEHPTHRIRENENKDKNSSSHPNTKTQGGDASSTKPDNSEQGIEEISTATTFSDSSPGTTSTNVTENANEDAFLCNIPNAPPFILKMNKVSPTSATTESHPEEFQKSEICISSLSSTSMDASCYEEDLSSASSFNSGKKDSNCTELVDLNMYIDGNSSCLENKEFKKFVAKSITWIKAEGARRSLRPRGLFMSEPTICMAGLTSLSNNPFGVDEFDSRRPGKNNGSFQNTDILYKKNSFHHHSKIPRMLHPGKCKVHSKMKNVQLSPGSKGCAANKASACTGPCPSNKTDIQVTPYVKVSVSTTCPSLTNASPSGNIKGGAKQGNKNKNANIQASQSSMGDCMKGIKSDPGCYCGNEVIEPTPCPIRLREDCECVEEEAAAQTGEPEEEEALCYCPPGEQPLLMKKSNIECDCANRRRCEDEALAEPPKEKPDVFWALTKVSLLKDGSKNFEIIDVSPVPPGYYLMPDVNNLVLVGPQPKPARASPSKNCSCK